MHINLNKIQLVNFVFVEIMFKQNLKLLNNENNQ